MQTAAIVALAADLFGERVGLEANRPDHRAGVDTLAVVQLHTGRVYRNYCGTANPLHAQGLACLLDGWADAVTQGCANPGAAVDYHYAQRGVFTQYRAQAGRQFGGRLDAGKAAPGYHYGIACRRVRQAGQ
ncbi:hypothetical protein D3C75_635420 [compost metagenome]